MKKTYILKVKADMTITREEFDEKNSLGQLQSAVNGFVERIPAEFKHNLDLWVNEEGLLKQLPTNVILTALCSMMFGRIVYLLGDGVFARHDEEGNILGIDEELAEKIEDIMIEIRDLSIRTAYDWSAENRSK
jgi:hypothetical protein